MSDPKDWPDPYVALSKVLDDLATVGAEAPADPNGTYSWLPFIRLTVIGGPDDGITDTSTIVADVFAGKRGDCSKLAGKVRQRLLNGPHVVANIAVVDDVSTITRPAEVPYGDVKKVRLYSATYQARMRRY